MCELSVVIPCWHDEQPLQQLLEQLRACATPTTALEVVVVDGARSEHCRELCTTYGAHWLPASPNRGEQLRMGAEHAQGEVLWFLHADAELQGNPLPLLMTAIKHGAVGGYFRFRFSGESSWQMRLFEQLVSWRNRLGTPYGDQGLFALRSSYFAVGQHAPWPLFEEVPLVKHLRAAGRFQQIDNGLLISPRRWQRDGWWRRALRNRVLVLGYWLGVSPERLARWYSGQSGKKVG